MATGIVDSVDHTYDYLKGYTNPGDAAVAAAAPAGASPTPGVVQKPADGSVPAAGVTVDASGQPSDFGAAASQGQGVTNYGTWFPNQAAADAYGAQLRDPNRNAGPAGPTPAPYRTFTPKGGQNGTAPGGGTAPPGTVGTPTTPVGTGSTGGIVNGATGSLAVTAPPKDNTQPVMADVQGNQTVQGQLSDILKNGNPLLEAGRARAAQAANARGLQNSSMATQAGEEAVVNTALPIAQQDAATYQKQALVNQDITNQFLSMDKGANLDLTKAYEAFKQNNFMFDKDAALKKYINDSGNTTQEKIAALQIAAQSALQATALQSDLTKLGMSIDSQKFLQQQSLSSSDLLNLRGLQANTNAAYAQGVNYINGLSLEPEAKANMLKTFSSVFMGNPYFTQSVDTSAFDTTPAATPGP